MAENIIVGDEDCLKITDILSQQDIFYTKWSDVFRRLNVPFETREPKRISLLNQSATPESVYYECLQVWRARESTQATVGKLISALVQCNLVAIADKLRGRGKFNVVPQENEEDEEPARKRRRESKANVIIGSKECKIISKEFLDHDGFHERWWDIFRNLNVSMDIINEKMIELAKEDSTIQIEDVYRDCLESWRLADGENATVEKFISILQRFQLNDIADELKEEYVSPDDIQRPTEPLSRSASWASLDKEKKKILIERNVTFQKRVTNMKTIFDELELRKKSLDTFMEKYLDEKLLADLHHDRNPVIVRDTIPVKIRYYIERFFLSRRGISEDAFENSSDIFLVSGIERPMLSKLAGRNLTDTARHQAEQTNLTVRYNLLELKTDFDAICHKTEKNVHWLKHEDGTFNWESSRGSMKAIQNSVSQEQKKIQESDFLCNFEDGSKAPVCISDSPGMGKTMALANLGRMLQDKHPERLVVFLVFSKFISQMKHVEANLDSMLEVLLKTFCKRTFESNLCQLYFKLKHLKIDILLDGLDEVNSADIKLALKCMKMLDSMPAVRVWVTTRPHHRNNLENSVQQLAFNIQAFDPENQISFLVRYWTTVSASDGVFVDEDKLKKFSKICLAILEEKTRDADKWAGVPLQCLLIAEVFGKYAVHFSNLINKTDANFIQSISISTLKELFDRLVGKKYELFTERYPEMFGDLTPVVILHLDYSHIAYALQVLIPDITFEALEINVEVLLKVGLVEASVNGETPQFIHLTFAEYFVAKFIHEVIQQELEFPVYMYTFFETMKYTEKLTIFKEIVPISFKFPVVIYFLNCFLDIHNSILPHFRCFEVNKINNLLKAAICGNHLSLFRWILKHPSACQEITSEHLFLAIWFSDVNVVEEAMKLFENKDILSLTCRTKLYEYKEMLSLLHVAAVRGEYKVFEYLLKNQVFTEYLNAMKTTSNGLIHCCVRDTMNDEDDVIKDRVHILTAILQLNRLILEEVWPVDSKTTPLLCHNVHVELLRAMISNGANALAQDDYGETVLHTAASYFSRDEYDQLIHHIPLPTFKTLVHIVDKYELTPIFKMIELLEPRESSLKYLIQHGNDVNQKDKFGCTCMFMAVLFNRSVECVETLLRLGVSGRNIDKNGGNLLHVAVAAEEPNKEVIERFWEEYDINSKDNNDNTPLHRACSEDEVWVRMVELLIELGANVNSKNREGNTPLHEAAASENENKVIIMEVLLEANSDHTITNLKLDTPLQHGLQNENINLGLIKMLLSEEKKVSEKTATLALFGILTLYDVNEMEEEDFFQLAESCLASGANMNFVNKDEQSNFQLAMIRRCFLGIKFLVEKGNGKNIYETNMSNPDIYECAKIQLDQVPSLKYHCQCYFTNDKTNCKLIWEELNKYPNLLRIPSSQSQM